MVVNSRDLRSLPKLTDQLMKVVFVSVSNFEQLVELRIFRPQNKLLKDERNFFEMLIFHSESEVRNMTSDILQTLFVQVFRSLT